MEDGRLMGGGGDASLWWRDIHALCNEEWFSGHVRRLVGNGKYTLCWSNAWIGGEELSVRFSRLYDLLLFRRESVCDMCQLGWGWMVRRGGGSGGCLCGRRSCWGTNFIASECELAG